MFGRLFRGRTNISEIMNLPNSVFRELYKHGIDAAKEEAAQSMNDDLQGG